MIRIIQETGAAIEFESRVYSGGEIEISLPTAITDINFCVEALLRTPQDLVELIMVSEIMERACKNQCALAIPYLPYGRQDRVTDDKMAFSLKAFAKIINSFNYPSIVTFDCHSDVTPALIENLNEVKMHEIINQYKELKLFAQDSVIVAPDAGANKKVFEVAKALKRPFVSASKHRNSKTGKIIDTKIHGDVAGKNAFIFDDICDGGQTFIELAKVLQEAGAAQIYLYVTHGIFRNGTDVFKGLINRIFTTDTICTLPETEDFRIAKIKDLGK